MNITKLNNPSINFFKSYENEILKTRDTLFHELDKTSTKFGDEARKILKLKLEANNNIPLLGEIFPWIIQDLVNSNTKTTQKISVGWLAIYLYTLFLDEHVDKPKVIPVNELIAGSLLAKIGLLKISRFVINTPYEEYIDKALSISAKNQQLDSEFNRLTIGLDFKAGYSEGKNYVVLACAGALAAQNSKDGDFILEFTKQLLLTLQYLDDFADFYDDFLNKNFTILLTETFKDNPLLIKFSNQATRSQVLSELITTGSMERVLEKVIVLLNQSMTLIHTQCSIESNKSSIEFFVSINTYCLSLLNYLKKETKNFNLKSREEREVILDRIENYLTLIAQSS